MMHRSKRKEAIFCGRPPTGPQVGPLARFVIHCRKKKQDWVKYSLKEGKFRCKVSRGSEHEMLSWNEQAPSPFERETAR